MTLDELNNVDDFRQVVSTTANLTTFTPNPDSEIAPLCGAASLYTTDKGGFAHDHSTGTGSGAGETAFRGSRIDVEEALRQLDRLPVSMHCWQGDDVSGFENPEGSLTGGFRLLAIIRAKARNASELRADLEQAMRLIPGQNGLIYIPSIWNQTRQSRATRSNLSTSKTGLNGRKANQLGLDFNPSCFSHPLSADGFSSPMPTTAFASSGLITAKPAVAFRPILASNSAHHR